MINQLRYRGDTFIFHTLLHYRRCNSTFTSPSRTLTVVVVHQTSTNEQTFVRKMKTLFFAKKPFQAAIRLRNRLYDHYTGCPSKFETSL